VLGALRALGHPHALLGLYDNLDLIRQKIAAFQPDVIFNILDCFKGIARWTSTLRRCWNCRESRSPAAARWG